MNEVEEQLSRGLEAARSFVAVELQDQGRVVLATVDRP